MRSETEAGSKYPQLGRIQLWLIVMMEKFISSQLGLLLQIVITK